jgi:DNA-binding NarL/FixJ family response regulator
VSRPRVILADDHPIVTEGLRYVLAARFDVIAVVEDGQVLLETARSLKPDVIVADISMPSINGIEATARLRQENPAIKVVILTMHREEAYARRALAVGASGYVLKVAAADELVAAIEAALAGKTFVTAEIADSLVGQRTSHSDREGDPVAALSQRQREILQLVAQGKTAKEIGTILDISARTVESHKYELLRALGVERTAELVKIAVRHGLIED